MIAHEARHPGRAGVQGQKGEVQKPLSRVGVGLRTRAVPSLRPFAREKRSARDWDGYLLRYESRNRLLALSALQRQRLVGGDEFGWLGSLCWNMAEFPHRLGRRFVLSLFKRAGFVHDGLEGPLPEVLVIYRGSRGGLDGRSWRSRRAFSWTTDEERARWFAARFAPDSGGRVLRAPLARRASWWSTRTTSTTWKTSRRDQRESARRTCRHRPVPVPCQEDHHQPLFVISHRAWFPPSPWAGGGKR